MKLKKNIISIITPVFNSQPYIDRTIKSVISQSYKNWELILIDDSSKDNSVNIISKYLGDKRIKLIKLKKNGGPGYCRNLGLKYSKGKFICFLDSDDIWKKDKLKIQSNFMIRNNIFFSSSNYLPFSANKKYRVVKPKSVYNFETFINDTAICTSSMMIKKNILKNIVFRKNYKFDDYIFKCMVLKKTKCANIQKTLVKYRMRDNSLSSKKLLIFMDVWKINRNIFKFNTLQNILSLINISISSLRRYRSF